MSCKYKSRLSLFIDIIWVQYTIWFEGIYFCYSLNFSYLKKQFQNADKNKNGSLTFDECLGLTEQLNIKMEKDRLRELFQVNLHIQFRSNFWLINI